MTQAAKVQKCLPKDGTNDLMTWHGCQGNGVLAFDLAVRSPERANAVALFLFHVLEASFNWIAMVTGLSAATVLLISSAIAFACRRKIPTEINTFRRNRSTAEKSTPERWVVLILYRCSSNERGPGRSQIIYYFLVWT